MPRRANPASPAAAPLRLCVYRELRAAIEQGRFPPGARLPPSREHARALGVSRNTVLWALERLRAEGYVQARVGDGSYVAPDLAALRPARASGAHRPSAPMLALSRRGQAIADTALGWQPPQQPALPFRIGAPDVAVFPYALWDRLARQLETLHPCTVTPPPGRHGRAEAPNRRGSRGVTVRRSRYLRGHALMGRDALFHTRKRLPFVGFRLRSGLGDRSRFLTFACFRRGKVG